jgi:HSP20 family protein
MMSLQRFGYSPFDEVLDTLDSVAGTPGRGWSWSAFSPAADVAETADGYRLEFDLPGLTEKDVTVTLEGKHLTLTGNRKAPEGETYTRRERGFGAFERVFHLPDDVDVGHIVAKAKNGVLTVTLPRAESAKPKSIDIVVG